MHLWKSASLWYLDLGNTIELTFASEGAARKYMAKLDVAKAIVKVVQSLATAADASSDVEAEYFDAGTFVDADVATLGITASDLAACITLLQQISKLMTMQATTVAMYRSTVNKVRRTVVS